MSPSPLVNRLAVTALRSALADAEERVRELEAKLQEDLEIITSQAMEITRLRERERELEKAEQDRDAFRITAEEGSEVCAEYQRGAEEMRGRCADYLEMNYDANLKWLLWRIRALPLTPEVSDE